MFLRQAGQDMFGLETGALKQLNQGIPFTRWEGNRMKTEPNKQEMATFWKLLLIGKDRSWILKGSGGKAKKNSALRKISPFKHNR